LKLTTIDLQAITQLRILRDAIFVEKVLFKNFSFSQVWECLDLIQKIQTGSCLHAVIQGPPGIGKSHGIGAVSCCHAASGNRVVHVFMEGTMFTAIILIDFASKDFLRLWLEEKYRFAGGSVRYMFAFSLSRVITSIDKAFKSQENISQLFGNEDSVADTSIGALRQCLGGNYFLLSQYVTRLLVERQDVTYQLIDALKGKADEMENGAFKGWIHELDMLTRLKQCVEGNTMSRVFEVTLIDVYKNTEKLVLKIKKAQPFYH
jgi:hypothetical protein